MNPMHNKIYFRTFFVILAFIAIIDNASLKAADSIKLVNSWKLAAGYSNLRIMDLQASPLKYSSFAFPVQFGFSHQSEKCIWDTDLTINIGGAYSTRVRNREISIDGVDEEGNPVTYDMSIRNTLVIRTAFNVEYLIRTGTFGNRQFTWYTGAQVQEYFIYMFTFSPIVMNQITVNPKACILYQFNKKTILYSSLSFSLFGFNSRMNYSIDPYSADHGYVHTFFAEGNDFNTLLNFQRLDFSLAAKIRLNERWSAGLSYHFYWFHHNEFQGLKAYDNSIYVSFYRTLNNKKK